MRALEAFPEAQNAYLGTCDAHSNQAAMWTRNPTGKLPRGRLALEFSETAIDWQRAIDIAKQMGAEVHWCKDTTSKQRRDIQRNNPTLLLRAARGPVR